MRNAKVAVSVTAWAGVLWLAFHQSEHQEVLGRYSLSYVSFLIFVVIVAGAVSLAKPSWMDRICQARAAIILSASSFLFAIGIAEVAVRVLDPLGVSYYEFSGEYQLDKQPDPSLVFRHVLSQQKRYGHVLVTYNEQGLRDRPILPKRLEEYRILALGDSVTFGWGVSQNEIFAARLEPLLRARFDRPVRLINSGVGGYNTVQEVAYFQQAGLRLQPDLVILTYVGNDIELNEGPFDPRAVAAIEGKSPVGAAMTMLGKLWLYRMADHFYHYGIGARIQQKTGVPPSGDRGWNASMSALTELVALCDERRIPLMIFFFRWQPSEFQPLFEDVGRHAGGYPVSDIERWFQGRDINSLMNSKVDSHPNAEGHRLIAEHMAEEIAGYVTK